MRNTRVHKRENPEIPGDGRQSGRTRVLHGAQIDFYNHAVKVDCVIRTSPDAAPGWKPGMRTVSRRNSA